MISSVTLEKTTYQGIPHRFEAGTPDIAGVVGLGAAIDYVTDLGLDEITAYEQDLLAYGTQALTAIPGVRLIGTARRKASILSFVLDGIHPHDIGTILDQEGIAVRTGHHCAQPLMDRFGVPATARASRSRPNRSSPSTPPAWPASSRPPAQINCRSAFTWTCSAPTQRCSSSAPATWPSRWRPWDR